MCQVRENNTAQVRENINFLQLNYYFLERMGWVGSLEEDVAKQYRVQQFGKIIYIGCNRCGRYVC